MSRRPRGFSLVEVVVSLAIFALVGLSVTSVLRANSRSNHLSRSTTEATTLAQNRIETIRSQVTPPTSGTTTSGIYSIQTGVLAGPVPGTLQVTVTVTWDDHGTRSVSLVTLIGT